MTFGIKDYFNCFLTSLYLLTNLHGNDSSIPKLASPLPAVLSDKTVSEEFIVNYSPNELYHQPSLKWLGSDSLIFENAGVIEIFNLKNSQWTSLVKGINPKSSPNGNWIAYLDNQDRQIWIVNQDGSQKRQLTFPPKKIEGVNGHNFDFAWAPDSERLALFINPVNPDPDCEALNVNLPPSTVSVINIQDGSTCQIYSEFALLKDLSWHPNGKSLLMSRQRIGFLYQENESQSFIQAVDISNGKVHVLAKFQGLQQNLAPESSPNGEHISFLYNFENEQFDWMTSVGIINYCEGNNCVFTRKQLTFDKKITQKQWAKDGNSILFVRSYGAYDHIYSLDLQADNLNQTIHVQFQISDFALSSDTQKLALLGTDPYGKKVVCIAKIDGTKVETIKTIEPLDEQIALSEAREIEWETIDYPTKMRGLLFMPNNYQEGVRYPLIVDVHGGGSGAKIVFLVGGGLMSTPLEWQFWTAKGYAVFVPEMRSSASFGWLAIARDEIQNYNIIDCDMKDILTGIDELVKMGIVDNNRLALIGFSAGARRANWITAASNRFKAIVSNDGWVDEWTMGLKYPGTWKNFGGSPEEVPENYQKNSAFFHLENATTPTLFLMGNPKLGGIDPDQTCLQLYHLLKDKGIETDYVYYEDDGHGFVLPKNRRDVFKRAIEWIDRHLSNF